MIRKLKDDLESQIYGCEDEEVMGLKFCNEAIIALKQIWPRTEETEQLSQLQMPNRSNSTILSRTLRLRLSPKALKLANKFTTASTTNNVEDNEAQVNQDNLGGMSRIDMGGAFQKCGESRGPEGSVDKPFLWTEGRVSLRAALNKSGYGHGEHISVTIE